MVIRIEHPHPDLEDALTTLLERADIPYALSERGDDLEVDLKQATPRERQYVVRLLRASGHRVVVPL